MFRVSQCGLMKQCDICQTPLLFHTNATVPAWGLITWDTLCVMCPHSCMHIAMSHEGLNHIQEHWLFTQDPLKIVSDSTPLPAEISLLGQSYRHVTASTAGGKETWFPCQQPLPTYSHWHRNPFKFRYSISMRKLLEITRPDSDRESKELGRNEWK